MLLLLSYLEFTATVLEKRQTRTYTTPEESKSEQQVNNVHTHQEQEANPQKNDSPIVSAAPQPKEPKKPRKLKEPKQPRNPKKPKKPKLAGEQNESEQSKLCKECKIPGCKMRCEEVGDSYVSILSLAHTTEETDYVMNSSILTHELDVKKKTQVKKEEKIRCKKPIRKALCTYNLYSSTDDQESDEDTTEELTSNNDAISKIEVLERIVHNTKELCIVETMGTFINKYKLLEELCSFADLLIDSNAKHHYTKIEKENRKKSEENRMIRSKQVVDDFAKKYKADYLENFKVDKQIKNDSETLINIRIYQITQFFGIVEVERTKMDKLQQKILQIKTNIQFSVEKNCAGDKNTRKTHKVNMDTYTTGESSYTNVLGQSSGIIPNASHAQNSKSKHCCQVYVSRSMIRTLKTYIDKQIDRLNRLIAKTPNAKLW